MSTPPQWLRFHEGVATEWTPTSMNEAWATYGEATAAFARYNIQAGWHLLEGPSGRAGHAWNASGPDIIAYRATGPFAMEINDNKAVADPANISSASALDRNLLANMRERAEHYAGRQHDNVPRIGEIRASLRATVRALETGSRQLPEGVTLIVTNAAGAPRNVTDRLARRGLEFRNVMLPSEERAVRNRLPPELYEVRGETAAAGRSGTRFSSASRAAAVVSLAVMVAGPALGRMRDWAERGRAEEQLRALEPQIREHIDANPDDGVLLVFVYRQIANISPDSLIGPVPVFHKVRVYYGRTYDEAFADYRSPGIVEGPSTGMEFVFSEKWIPPPMPTDPNGFCNRERGLDPEERGTLPSEHGLGDAPTK